MIRTTATASSLPQSFKNDCFSPQAPPASLSFAYSVPSAPDACLVLPPAQLQNLCSIFDSSFCYVPCNWELLLANPIGIASQPTLCRVLSISLPSFRLSPLFLHFSAINSCLLQLSSLQLLSSFSAPLWSPLAPRTQCYLPFCLHPPFCPCTHVALQQNWPSHSKPFRS